MKKLLRYALASLFFISVISTVAHTSFNGATFFDRYFFTLTILGSIIVGFYILSDPQEDNNPTR